MQIWVGWALSQLTRRQWRIVKPSARSRTSRCWLSRVFYRASPYVAVRKCLSSTSTRKRARRTQSHPRSDSTLLLQKSWLTRGLQLKTSRSYHKWARGKIAFNRVQTSSRIPCRGVQIELSRQDALKPRSSPSHLPQTLRSVRNLTRVRIHRLSVLLMFMEENLAIWAAWVRRKKMSRSWHPVYAWIRSRVVKNHWLLRQRCRKQINIKIRARISKMCRSRNCINLKSTVNLTARAK